jgi:2',3'-cyclic-nucleotide 2'-phosphodiesterase (5'-nucleotidase family)
MMVSYQPSGTLHLLRGQPSPNGVEQAQLFLLSGDPTAAPVREILPDGGVTLPPARADLADQPFHLCLLHCNDLHGHISHITTHGERPIFSQAVFSRMVWRLRELRQHFRSDPNAAVVFLSAGDDLMGIILGELLGDDLESYVVHAGYHLYSAAGLDAGVLGNHELDLGPDMLVHALRRDARFPMLSANLAGCRQLDGVVYPAAILVVKGLRVGIAGLTTRGQVKRSSNLSRCMADPLQTASNLIPALRPLCDILIMLSHLGHSLVDCSATVLDGGDVELAQSLPRGSIDLIVGGHTHHALNQNGLSITNIVNGVPIVQAGAQGQFLGQVDITIGRRVTVTDARLFLVADLKVDEAFEGQAVQPLLAQVRPLLARRLGRVADHPDLSTEAVRQTFASRESALANFVTDAIVARCRAAGHAVSLAAIDGSSVYQGLPASDELSFGDWFDLMPYADTIRLCPITGSELQALLDDNARRADRPGEPHTERGFLQFSQQLHYTIELGTSRRQARATGVTLDGVPLEEQADRDFLFACTSFCRETALPWERYASQNLQMPLTSLPVDAQIETELLVRDEMIAHILEHGGVTEEAGVQRDGRLTILDE